MKYITRLKPKIYKLTFKDVTGHACTSNRYNMYRYKTNM